MDPVTHFCDRLRQLRQADDAPPPAEPPAFEDWLRYWNDEDSDLGNLRNLEHWLSRSRHAS